MVKGKRSAPLCFVTTEHHSPRRRAQAIVAEHSVFGYESTDSESPATVSERSLSAADEVGGEAADFVAVENVKHS